MSGPTVIRIATFVTACRFSIDGISIVFLVPLLIALTALACLWRTRRSVEGTTLVGMSIWNGISFVVTGVALSVLAWRDEPATWQPALRFATVTTSFCPMMFLLGAKRPQDKPWHFIVLSLWIVLALPAAENLVLRPGQPLDVRGARSWFLAILIAIGIVNAVATRYWPAGVLGGLGQMLMLADFLPLLSPWLEKPAATVGFALFLMAFLLGKRGSDGAAKPLLDRVWLDFRDSFGLLWGLRLQERINSVAESNSWPIVLRWQGFRDSDGMPVAWQEVPPEVATPLRQSLDNVLRRFVSRDWISQRLPESLD